jgi:hypothetical protein
LYPVYVINCRKYLTVWSPFCIGLSDHGHELLPGERDQPTQDRVQPEPGEGSLHGNGGGYVSGRSRGRIHGRINQVSDIFSKIFRNVQKPASFLSLRYFYKTVSLINFLRLAGLPPLSGFFIELFLLKILIFSAPSPHWAKLLWIFASLQFFLLLLCLINL